ncbi:MAG TPA: hypothetical protein VG797_06175 [Phycisphaerales bacterium]|nr:hypothetical protein [Phycisphaerales bacterium]
MHQHFRLPTSAFRPLTLALLISPLLPLTFAPSALADAASDIAGFTIRPGYTVTLAADNLTSARFMEQDDKGNLYLSQPDQGSVQMLREPDAQGLYKTRTEFITGQPTIHGLCWHDGWLYASTSGTVLRAKDTNADGKADTVETIIGSGLPSGGNHWWRSLLVTDHFIYTSVGDSGNITDERETDRQKIWRFNLDGSHKTFFVGGIRNTEKLRFRPGTEEIWGCDHGSDNFGRLIKERTGRNQPVTDFNPPDELNRYTEGGFYGHPFITGLRSPRYEFMNKEGIDLVDLASKTVPPQWCFPAHVATNGHCFIDPTINGKNNALPADHSGDLFVACHGSWNRVEPSGYYVLRVLFDRVSGKPYGSLPIVTTISPDGKKVLGRPVDCVQTPDGSVLFSDDFRNRIYRIRSTDARK